MRKNSLNLMYASIPYALQFVNCHFAVGVEMVSTECAALCLDESYLAHGLRADGLTTKDNVHMRRFSAKGEVRLTGANIGKDFSCMGGNIHNPSGYALNADKLMTEGSADLSGGFSAEGGVRLSGANIGGNLICKGGEFIKLQRYALVANGITVKGSMFLSDGFFAEGEVSLLGANISGDLMCRNGKFHNPRRKIITSSGKRTKTGGKALVANGVTMGGHMLLVDGFFAEGGVNMWGADISGNLDCGGGEFTNLNKYALHAERVKTGGHVYLNKLTPDRKGGFVAHGRVRFANADIGRNFNCKGGRFFHLGKESAIAAAGLRTRGAVFLSDDFVVQGDVDMKVAQIGGNFVCKECGSDTKGNIDLSSTKAVAVDDDSNTWKKFNFILDGFTYDIFFGENTPKDKSRLDWLTSRPLKRWIKGKEVEVPFSPLPYGQAAKVLFNMGHDNAARKILLEKERGITKHGKWQWWQYLLRKGWEKLAGYGYQPALTFCMSLFVVFIGAGVFWLADCAGRIVPHQPAALANVKYQYGRIPSETPAETVARKLSGYPEFNPILFSLDIFVPLFNLHQEPFWYPSPDGGIRPHWWSAPKDEGLSLWFLLEWWYWFQICFGWLLTSLFLLSVTGLLRPRESSGGTD